MNFRFTALPVLAAAAAALGGCTNQITASVNSATSAKMAACSTFTSQPAAQAAWEAAGNPAGRDGDRDGVVCENLAQTPKSASDAKSCMKSKRTVIVLLSRSKYPETSLNIETAWAAGQPQILHWQPGTADAARAKWEPLVPLKDGYDRDEWPMAATAEGMNGTSQIAYVNPSDNRGAGSTIAARVRRYCAGTPFKVSMHGKRRRPVKITVAANGGRKVKRVISG